MERSEDIAIMDACTIRERFDQCLGDIVVRVGFRQQHVQREAVVLFTFSEPKRKTECENDETICALVEFLLWMN